VSDDISASATALIGKTKTRTLRVTEQNIRRFRQAIGDDTPERRGARGLIAPPLFYQTFAYEDVPVEDLPADGSPLELDVPIPAQKTVGGGSEFELFEYAQSGDEIIVSSQVKNIYTKEGRSGLLYFVVVETCFERADGELMAREAATYVKRL